MPGGLSTSHAHKTAPPGPHLSLSLDVSVACSCACLPVTVLVQWLAFAIWWLALDAFFLVHSRTSHSIVRTSWLHALVHVNLFRSRHSVWFVAFWELALHAYLLVQSRTFLHVRILFQAMLHEVCYKSRMHRYFKKCQLTTHPPLFYKMSVDNASAAFPSTFTRNTVSRVKRCITS